MAWIYEALEMHDRRGKPLGKYRVARWQHLDPAHIEALCDHQHESRLKALNCPIASRILDEQFDPLFHHNKSGLD